MSKIGVDFDNTLIKYDDIFYKIAISQQLIDESVSPTKKAIKHDMQRRKKDSEFTRLQAEVYGRGIKDAEPTLGSIEALKRLKKEGHEVYIISHKTLNPIKGPKYDLREAASNWLVAKEYFEESGVGLSRKNVFFENTKEEKVARIKKIGCEHFIDDLEEILEMIDAKINRILYSEEVVSTGFKLLKNWQNEKELDRLIGNK